MKVLAPTDFSICSINALKYAAQYLDSLEGEQSIEITHCIDHRYPSRIISKFDDLLKEEALVDLEKVMEEVKSVSKNVTIETSLFKAKTKEFIPRRAKEIGADLIAIGTTGLTNLKNITVGSVTEYVAKHTSIPVLTIPPTAKFKSFENVVLGIDEHSLDHPEKIELIYNLIASFEPLVYLVQVLAPSQKDLKLNTFVQDHLKDLRYEIHTATYDVNISNTLNKFVLRENAELLCMVHRRKNWFSNLFHHSVMKEELFRLERPLLIIPD